jgi:hypothetical protein
LRGFATLSCPKESRDCNDEARTSFERALEIDPSHAEAPAGIAETYYKNWFDGWATPGPRLEAFCRREVPAYRCR